MKLLNKNELYKKIASIVDYGVILLVHNLALKLKFEGVDVEIIDIK